MIIIHKWKKKQTTFYCCTEGGWNMQMLVLQYPCAGFSFVANFNGDSQRIHRITGWKNGDSNANVCWVWKVDKMFLCLLPFRLYALTAAESVLNVIVITSWLDEMVLAVMVCFVVCSQIRLTSKRFVMWFSRAVELQEAKTTLSVIICSIIG